MRCDQCPSRRSAKVAALIRPTGTCLGRSNFRGRRWEGSSPWLWIFNNGGDLLYHKIDHGYCCPFQAPAPGFNIPHSSIYWDAYTNLSAPGLCAGCPVSDGTYFYILHLHSDCGAFAEYTGYITVLDGPGFGGGGEGMMQQIDDNREALLVKATEIEPAGSYQGTDKEVVIQPLTADDPIRVFPNPTIGEITIQCMTELSQVEVRDALGRAVMTFTASLKEEEVDLSRISQGSYTLVIRDAAGRVYLERIMKQQ